MMLMETLDLILSKPLLSETKIPSYKTERRREWGGGGRDRQFWGFIIFKSNIKTVVAELFKRKRMEGGNEHLAQY